MSDGARFWETKGLAELSEEEWESLCDGCGKCCLIRLEDEDTGETWNTDVHCRLFDSDACGCSDYANRKDYVPDCVKLTPDNVQTLDWMPRTCAYRLVAEGAPLYHWHHLISGNRETIHDAGMSIRNQTIPEGRLKPRQLMKRLRFWPGEDR
jgi:uncharacterized protein